MPDVEFNKNKPFKDNLALFYTTLSVVDEKFSVILKSRLEEMLPLREGNERTKSRVKFNTVISAELATPEGVTDNASAEVA
ncbi:hypothetical protein SAMN02982917_3270 [Azospirillum oryzae]|uniref:Uncharacterized protein n=1 Tax=Azospirillum oryzae TaxID=286727 RepID=A0A1X7G4W8_9PROT|nr:hypothetical protein [Azospirillum oryzae]SMF64020.1 hypothetical protein SAMN02982917_3270 [Azospirillum oryzae]